MQAATSSILGYPTTLALHRHNLGHGSKGKYDSGEYLCSKVTVRLEDIRENLTSLGVEFEYFCYYSPVGHWEQISFATENGFDAGWYLAKDMAEEGFDMEEFKEWFVTECA